MLDTVSPLAGPAPQAPIRRSPELRMYLAQNAVFGDTVRFRQIERLQSFYRCSPYSHLERDWWGLSADAMETISPSVQVPLGYEQPMVNLNVRQKRPTAPLNLTRLIVDRFTGLLFSEDRKPDVVIENDQDTEDWMKAVLETSRFWAKYREARAYGGSSGSVLVTCHLRDGAFAWDIHNPRDVQFFWKNRSTFDLGGVLIMYKHPVDEVVTNPKTGEQRVETVYYLYRRIISEDEDIVYQPVRMEPGVQVLWDDPADDPGSVIQAQVEHNLGFFPGAWIQNLSDPDSEDGAPDCAGAFQLIDTIDRLVSQINKATILNLDPTPVIKADPKLYAAGLLKGSDNAIRVGQDGDAKYMEMLGGGVKAGMDLVAELRKSVFELTRFVDADPDKVSGAAQSAKAIELLMAPMLEKADDLRGQWGDGIVRLLKVAEQIARKVGPERVILPPKIVMQEPDDQAPPGTEPQRQVVQRKLGPGGYYRLDWGKYFSPTVTDLQVTTQTLLTAKTGDLLDEETAVRQFCAELGIRDPEGVLKRVRVQRARKLDEAMASLGDGGVPAPMGPPALPNPPQQNRDEQKGPPVGQGGKP